MDNSLNFKDEHRLIEQVPYGFLIMDRNGEIFDVNKFACEVLGYERTELIQRGGVNLFNTLKKYNFNELVYRTLDLNEKLSFDDSLENCNSTKIPVEITAGKFQVINNSLILVMFQDIINRVQVERIVSERQREIEEINKSLEQRIQIEIKKNMEKDQLLIQQSKMAAMGDMMGNIAHQWRQPLNTLSLAIQDVEEAFNLGELDEKYMKHFIDISMENIRFMSKTIDDFRNFFKPSKMKESFKLRDAISDILKIVTAQLKNHKINISLHGENYDVLGYPNEFKQVILNLANNAKDAILEKKIDGGEINIFINSYSNVFKEVVVQDNGGGIPEKIMSKIFEPYFTTKDGSKGTGIGLYMSKTIIEENMSGELFVENKNGGARFTIRIPCDCSEN